MMIRLGIKIISYITLVLMTLIGIIIFIYLKIFPVIISNENFINFIKNNLSKNLNINLIIEKPILNTSFSPTIEFKIKKLKAEKNNNTIIEIEQLDSSFSLRKIFEQKLIINKLGAENIFIDSGKIAEIFSSSDNKSNNKNKFNIDFYNSFLYINNCFIILNPNSETIIELKAKNLNIDNQTNEKFLHFDFDANITKDNKKVYISFKDENKILIKNHRIYVNNCPFIINKSKMYFDINAASDKDFELIVYANNFLIPDIIKLLQTNIIENNINEPLEYIKNINGSFDFNIKLTNSDFNGNIKLNKLSGNLFPINNMPFIIRNGNIKIKQNDIILTDFKGYYDNKIYNEFNFDGTVKDYLKSLDTNIDMLITLTNDFFEKYISKTAGIPLSLKGKSKSKLLIHSINNNIKVILMGKIAKGDDILVDGASLSPIGYDRAFKAILNLNGDNLNIETINYYIAKELNKESHGIKPILTLDGNMRISDGKIFDLGFDIPSPLPSEFLNVLIGQKLFKNGKFSGNMRMIAKGEYPILEGNLNAEKIRIPSQRLFLNEGNIKTNQNEINIKANGKYRKCSYIFNGSIINSLLFPIIIKHTDLTVDNVDVERIMKAFTTPVSEQNTNKINNNEENNSDDSLDFDIRNIIINECILKIEKGRYKEINFSNILANMTLDKNGILKLKSNKFDIAEGHSSADINCDLVNQKFNIRLGIKDVNSDVMSTALLNLKREISGKASGLIELNTDSSLKLNGCIKFIVKDGTIQKIGLVEYVLKFAALFRNPFAMISPSIFSDLVNIPEGNFDKITGELFIDKNIIKLLKIKSNSPQLSSYIVGMYNLENSDSILRIYTKFSNKNKGISGVLRNISLNSLANRIPLNTRNDINYYASELEQLPPIDADEKDCQIFLTKVDGDVEHNNFISSLKKIK